MALASPRADNLSIICDIVLIISKFSVTERHELNEAVESIRAESHPWKRTRRYHYFSALKDLGLANFAKGNIALTRHGLELASVATLGNLERRQLNENEQAFLKQHLLFYSPFRAFMQNFLCTSECFENYEQLKSNGGIVAFLKDPETKAEVMIKANAEVEPLPKRRVYEIKWTLKSWCKDLTLIDEIFLEPAMANIGERCRRVFFPIKTSHTQLPLNEFRSKIDDLMVSSPNPEMSVRIPLLMYDFCTTYFLPVKDFHYLLAKLYEMLPSQYRLEKISSVYIDETPHYRLKRGGYTNYPKIGDCYRYSLVVR